MPQKRKKTDQQIAASEPAKEISRTKSQKISKAKASSPVMEATTGLIQTESAQIANEVHQTSAATPLAIPSSMRTKMLIANLTFVMMIAAVVSATVLISRQQQMTDAPAPSVAGVQQVSNTALGFQFDLPSGWTARLISDGAILSSTNVEKGLIVLHVLDQDKAKALLEEQKRLPESMDVNAIDLLSPQLGQLNRFQIDGDKMYWWSLLSPMSPADQSAAAAFYRVTSTALIGKQLVEATSAIFYATEDGYQFSYPLTHRASRLTDAASKKAFSFLPADSLKSLVTLMTVDGKMDGVFVNTSLDMTAASDILIKAGNAVDPEKSNATRIVSRASLDSNMAFIVTVLPSATGTLWIIDKEGSNLGLADRLHMN